MSGGRDKAFWTNVAVTVELVMAHPVAVETGRPVSYMRVWERLIVLGQGQIWGVRGAWVVGDMKGGRECGTFSPEVIQEGVYLGDGGPHAELGTGSEEGSVEVDIAALEKSKKSAYLLVVGNVFNEGNEGVPHSHVVGVGFSDETDRRLGVDGAV